MVEAIFVPLLFVLLHLVVVGGAVSMKEGMSSFVSVKELQWGNQKINSNSHFSNSHKTSSSTMMELKHHISSASAPLNSTRHHQNLLLSDEARASSLQSRICAPKNNHHPQSREAQIPLTSGVALQTLNYIIDIKLGGNNMTVIVDTGSDLTWVQCKPCSRCYSQHNPLYDPSTSSTYHPIPCNSTSCTSLLPPTAAPPTCSITHSSCAYGVKYGDGSYTIGLLALENLGLGDTNIEGFAFGCGRANRGLFGGTSGLAGLGRTPLSLVSQTKAQFGGVFSYCLPSRIHNSSGNLVLGGDASLYKNATPIAYTSMLLGHQQYSPFYFINLTGMSVGGVNLGPSKGVRVLIDSGTVITRVVPSIYASVKDEFLKQFAGYPRAPSFSILDTCFDLSKYEEVRVPNLGLGFEGGVDVSVDVSGVFYFVKEDASQACLAMTSLEDEDGVGIIGNYQQKNQRIVYDNAGFRVGFAVESCSYS